MLPHRKFSALIVHHAPIMRFGLRTLLQSSCRFVVVGDTGDAPVAVRIFTEKVPNLVMLSLTLQRGDGISLLRDLRKIRSAFHALVITARNDSLSLQRAFRAGATGCVGTTVETPEVLQALERISTGELYASATVARGLLETVASGVFESRRTGCGQLSDRELQVFRLIGSGCGTSHVARELSLSVKTIETHRQRIKRKLCLSSGEELTQRATEWLLAAARKRDHSSQA